MGGPFALLCLCHLPLKLHCSSEFFVSIDCTQHDLIINIDIHNWNAISNRNRRYKNLWSNTVCVRETDREWELLFFPGSRNKTRNMNNTQKVWNQANQAQAQIESKITKAKQREKIGKQRGMDQKSNKLPITICDSWGKYELKHSIFYQVLFPILFLSLFSSVFVRFFL